jgi:hypothetical protein
MPVLHCPLFVQDNVLDEITDPLDAVRGGVDDPDESVTGAAINPPLQVISISLYNGLMLNIISCEMYVKIQL